MKKKILIIEDDNFFRQLLVNKLEEDFDIEVATDGVEGEKKIYEWQPDLVVLDMILPEKEGIEILKTLNNNPPEKKPIIVVVSNVMIEEDMDRAKSLGVHHYFVKAENTPNELVAKIKMILS
ncbi:Alkaline phosphatase synthesis transcriptional regulatory protein PhoP [bacterium HR34]|nr:Alkaline phosphatase synthesis transcriptional regulatory protein PhoP [bacterium HR34]